MKACKFYLTYLCNSRCSYCNIWCKGKTKMLSLKQIKKRLDELKKLGVDYVDFTGGEPMLYPKFIAAIKYAKRIGMKVEFTTNGYMFDKYLDEAIKYIDYPNVSLDTLNREKYKRIRGIDGLENAKHVAKRLGEKSRNARIICVVTEENVDEIPEMLKFAQESNIQIYFSPLFSYFDEMKEKYASSKYDIAILDKLFFEPQTVISSHFIEFCRHMDSNKESMCMCNKDVITISPEGKVISPCYYYQTSQLGKYGDSIVDIVNSKEFKCETENVGKHEACKVCTAIPYLGFSFEYNLNYVSLLELFSLQYTKFKVAFLNREKGEINFDMAKLNNSYDVLRNLLLSIPKNDTKHLVYNAVNLHNGMVTTNVFKEDVSVVKYFYDNLSSNVWQLGQMLPFKFLEKFSDKIIPTLKADKEKGKIREKTYLKVLEGFPMFYLSWWLVFIYKKYNIDSKFNIDISMYEKNIKSYMKYIQSKMQRHPEIIDGLSFDFEKLDIMFNSKKSYLVPSLKKEDKSVSLSEEKVNKIVTNLKNKPNTANKLLYNLTNYDLETVNLIIKLIKEEFSQDEIAELKKYIDVYRYHDLELFL